VVFRPDQDDEGLEGDTTNNPSHPEPQRRISFRFWMPGCLDDPPAYLPLARLRVLRERTAAAHVGNILAKLGMNSRAQNAAMAQERGLTDAGADESGQEA
jgi:hypothetical protein